VNVHAMPLEWEQVVVDSSDPAGNEFCVLAPRRR
jgi:hypothetical protein